MQTSWSSASNAVEPELVIREIERIDDKLASCASRSRTKGSSYFARMQYGRSWNSLIASVSRRSSPVFAALGAFGRSRQQADRRQ